MPRYDGRSRKARGRSCEENDGDCMLGVLSGQDNRGGERLIAERGQRMTRNNRRDLREGEALQAELVGVGGSRI